MFALCDYGVLLTVAIPGNMIYLSETFSGDTLLFSILCTVFLALPFVLTLYNIFYLVCPSRFGEIQIAGHGVEYLTAILGVIYSYLWVALQGFSFFWNESLNHPRSPLAKEFFPTVLVCAVVAVVGYGILRYFHSRPVPVTVVCFGAMYMGITLCAVWIFQMIDTDKLLCLAPFNFILIAVKVMKEEISARRALNGEREDVQFWEKGIHWLWIAAAAAVLLFAL